ncbi:MAG TPA: hypothetical protein VMU24_00835 [Candidatus Acidoferrales bacterium]|nr:hypothetical protein [Candidatus Acidoferrales bacterium]
MSAAPSVSVQQLVVVDRIPTKLEQDILFASAHCDEDGNSYVRYYALGAGLHNAGKILKLSPRGEPLVTFADQIVDYSPISFFVAHDGSVFDLAAANPKPSEKKTETVETVLLVYDKDHGNLKKTVKLEPRISPFGAMAVFPSGEILISALEPQGSGPDTPFTALLDDSGKLIRRILPEYDSTIAAAYEKHDQKSKRTSESVFGTVSQGTIVIGSDGNAYLLRKTSPAVVYVISRYGEVVRTLTASPEDPTLSPLSMLESNGELAILFSKPGKVTEREIKVLSARSGDVLQTVKLRSPFGSSMTCFVPPRFTFVRVEEEKFVLYIGEPH